MRKRIVVDRGEIKKISKDFKVTSKAVWEALVYRSNSSWKSHATLTLLATQDCPLWLQYD